MRCLSILFLCISSARGVDVLASAAVSSGNFASISTDVLIEMLRTKYNIRSLEDVRTWDSAEEQKYVKQHGEYPPEEDFHIPKDCKDFLGLLVGLRPMGTLNPMDNLKTDSIIAEILKREDCPVKFVFIFYGDMRRVYMYDFRDYEGKWLAYLLAKYDIETNLLISRDLFDKDKHIEASYIDGKILSYPEVDIKEYIGNENWERAKKLGQQWLEANRTKTIDQLKLEIWQLIQEYESRRFLK